MNKLGKQICRKCGENMNIRYIPSSGMDIEPTGMRATCTRCGFSKMIESLDEKQD